MQEAYKVAEVHERVGSLEQEVHTLKHQVLHLEKIPPRVSELERAFEGMQYIRADQVEIKASLRTINDSQQRLSGDIEGFSRAIKWIGGLLSLAAMVTAAVVWVTAQ